VKKIVNYIYVAMFLTDSDFLLKPHDTPNPDVCLYAIVQISHVLASSVSDNAQRLKKVHRKKQAYLAIIALIGGLISSTDSRFQFGISVYVYLSSR